MTYKPIAECALRYAAALDELRGCGCRIERYEAVLAARLELANCLTQAGWTPAPAIERALAHDRMVLRETCGPWEQREPCTHERIRGTMNEPVT